MNDMKNLIGGTNFRIIIIIVSLILFCQAIDMGTTFFNSTPFSGTTLGQKSDYYDFVINSPNTQLTTDGKEEVVYTLNIINSGNREDTITLYSELTDVSNCTEPNSTEWDFWLNQTLVTIQPSQSVPIKFYVKSACTCQEGCRATILVHGISNGDLAVRKNLTTHTTRGPPSKPKLNLDISIDYDPYSNILALDTLMKLNVDVWNLQGKSNIILIWVNEAPETWSVGLSPDEFYLDSTSKRTIELHFKIPKGTPNAIYKITLTAQPKNDPNIQAKDSINLKVKPDIIIENVNISKSKLFADEKVKISVDIKNVGLATAEDVPIEFYDELIYNSLHKVDSKVISSIEPNQTIKITFDWTPSQGKYNLSFNLNRELIVDEINVDNNRRIEPVVVLDAKKSSTNDEESSYLLYLMVTILIVVVLIILVILVNHKKKNDNGGQESILSETEFDRGSSSLEIKKSQKSTHHHRKNRSSK